MTFGLPVPEHPLPPRIPRVDESQCRVCRRCVARQACRVKAMVAIDPGEPPFVDGSRCYGCLVCVPACPHEAILA
jgi:MinD superfamily P-loop ATPase